MKCDIGRKSLPSQTVHYFLTGPNVYNLIGSQTLTLTIFLFLLCLVLLVPFLMSVPNELNTFTYY